MILRMADQSKWATVVAEWRASGESALEYCRKRELSVHSLRYWSHRLNAASRSEQPGGLRLARVVREGTASSMSEIVLERSGVRVTVGTGFDRVTLRAVLEVLGELGSK
jgi:hypothetical protein